MKPDVWNQLKNITSGELVTALEQDGWTERARGGSAMVYKKQSRRVSVHVHSHKTFGANQLKDLFDDIGWTEQDLRRLKLIK
jgi:predicted RNA binding protein YcfA (HicA-like mRNA interferase family)